MNEELIQIPEENILMEFYIEDQEYVVFTETPEEEEYLIYFAKRDYLEEHYILRNIESDDEYNMVLAKYEELLALMESENDETEEENHESNY